MNRALVPTRFVSDGIAPILSSTPAGAATIELRWLDPLRHPQRRWQWDRRARLAPSVATRRFVERRDLVLGSSGPRSPAGSSSLCQPEGGSWSLQVGVRVQVLLRCRARGSGTGATPYCAIPIPARSDPTQCSRQCGQGYLHTWRVAQLLRRLHGGVSCSGCSGDSRRHRGLTHKP